jgi:hypothetical protein
MPLPSAAALIPSGENGYCNGVVTLSEISQIWAIEQQAKWLKSHTSAFAVVGNLRSI